MTVAAVAFPAATVHPCPAKTCGPACHACLGHRSVHLLAEASPRSVKAILADIAVLADQWGETFPGAFLYPDGTVVYGVETGRRVVDQPGYRPPRLRVVRS